MTEVEKENFRIWRNIEFLDRETEDKQVRYRYDNPGLDVVSINPSNYDWYLAGMRNALTLCRIAIGKDFTFGKE